MDIKNFTEKILHTEEPVTVDFNPLQTAEKFPLANTTLSGRDGL